MCRPPFYFICQAIESFSVTSTCSSAGRVLTPSEFERHATPSGSVRKSWKNSVYLDDKNGRRLAVRRIAKEASWDLKGVRRCNKCKFQKKV